MSNFIESLTKMVEEVIKGFLLDALNRGLIDKSQYEQLWEMYRSL